MNPTTDDFLSRWEPNRRSLIANQFCVAVRAGCADPDSVVDWVRGDAWKRLADRYADHQRPSQELLLRVLDLPEARDYAVFIIHREAMPRAERERQKAEAAATHQKAWMARQAPTVKQLEFLKALGCGETPKDRLQASQLIEEYKSVERRKSYGDF
jgi:hypothetical protein